MVRNVDVVMTFPSAGQEEHRLLILFPTHLGANFLLSHKILGHLLICSWQAAPITEIDIEYLYKKNLRSSFNLTKNLMPAFYDLNRSGLFTEQLFMRIDFCF